MDETQGKDSKNTNPSPPKTKKQWILENVISLGLALLLVFMVRSSIIEAFKIPSGSMIPTLLVGDHVFVNKFSYGFKLPFSDWILQEPIYLYKREPPKRGDIIVFIFPKDEKFYYIKRVMGVPGDQIEIHNKEMFINGQKIERQLLVQSEGDQILKLVEDSKYGNANLELYREKLDTASPVVIQDKNNFFTSEFGPITVPVDQFFVMGDNRDFSNDSRFWGFVPMKNIKGKAMVIWLSMWISFSDSQYYFRPKRIGTVLH